MSMLSKLLINSFIIFASSSAVANTSIVTDNIDVVLSGYFYATVFADKEWQEDTYRVAANIDGSTNNFRVNLQVGNDDNGTHFIRRAFVEASYPSISDGKHSHHLKIGRFPRLASFHNNATDTPATSGMALLPFAGYNYRFQDGTFTSLDGVEYTHMHSFSRSMILAKASYGKMYIDDEKELNRYLFSSHMSGIEIEPVKKSYDYSFHHETKDSHLFYSKTRYAVDTNPTKSAKPTEKFISAANESITYEVDRFGIRYHVEENFIQAEYIRGVTLAASARGKISYNQTAKDHYVLVGRYLTDSLSVYAGYSDGRATEGVALIGPMKTKTKTAEDAFIGMTNDTGKVVVSAAYHRGKGRPYTKIGSHTDNWSSLVLSVTNRF